MKKEDLRNYAMYGLSILIDKTYKDYFDSNFTDETVHRLWLFYIDSWNELYHDELEEQKK